MFNYTATYTDHYQLNMAQTYFLNTIIDAIDEGFSSTLIEDASRPLSQETFAFLKKELTNKGVRIINSDEIIPI